MGRKTVRNIVNLGLKLESIDQTALLELSQLLEDLLLNHLRATIPGLDFQVSIEVELGETLDVAVDVVLTSPVPISPEILAQIDWEVDKAISEFERIIALKYKKEQS
ncbi:MAG: hypothetical protein RMI56_00550 [Sulfolobales archaeon]|nr:hypothetical protein [Sulfolobales archaeon]MDW8082269.1 hypothetical protein [Sulfolobales archaeon]